MSHIFILTNHPIIFSESLSAIAFSAPSSKFGPNMAYQTIVFDKVFINAGNDYNPQTGMLTCSVSGVYTFTWSNMPAYHSSVDHCDSAIYKNGDSWLETRAHVDSSSATNTIVFRLAQGDQVWVKTKQCGYYNGYPYTSFSGWKM